MKLADRIIDGLDPSMIVSPRDVARRSGTVVVDPGGDLRPVLMARLAEARVHVDERADGIRVSPHLINTGSDIDAFLDVATEVRT